MDPLRNIPRLSELSGHLLRLPTTDRGTFATLTSVSDIQEWTRSKADEYRQFALALLALHNLAAPIHRLPTEVLERILEQCWQDWKSLRLPHVCRLWRSIILGRAAFWADAVADCELIEKRDVAVARNELPLIDALLSRSTQHAHTIKPSFYTFPRSIAESLTPYISNVVSLQVAVGEGDLHERLWPLLLSWMPNLEALTIQLTIAEEDLSRYDEEEHGDLAHYHSKAWGKLPMLSRKTLPKLSRLTCPHNMIGRFGDVLLRHLKLECIDRSELSLSHIPVIALCTRRGLHLEPYRDCLETLEVMRTWFKDDDPHPPAPPKPVELPSLRYLRIASDDEVTSWIVSWLLLPQTAFTHITHLSDYPDGTELHSTLGTIDRLCLQQVTDYRERCTDYHLQCFARDRERLRIDRFTVFRNTLLPVFGENAPVTHLVLSVMSHTSGALRGIDLHAFPHLVQLDATGSENTIPTIAFMLQPDLPPHYRRVWQAEAAESPSPPCLRLTQLVIACGSLVRSTSGGRSTSLLPGSDLGADVDKLFQQQCAVLQQQCAVLQQQCAVLQQQCAVLQQALADRASHGVRLTHLTLRLRPAATSEPPDNDSKDSADNGAVESNAVWPSHAARQSVLQNLQELVNGPVVLKFLDSAGGEMSVDEA